MLFNIRVYKRDPLSELRFERGIHWIDINYDIWTKEIHAIDYNFVTKDSDSINKYRLFNPNSGEFFI